MSNYENQNHWFIGTDNLILDENINNTQKLILMKLTALSNQKGYAFCSNQYLSELFKIAPQNISKNINILEKKGYLKCEYDEKNHRTILLMFALIPINANIKTPINASVKHNNKDVNNKDVNNKEEKKKINKKEKNQSELNESANEYFSNPEVNDLFIDFLALRITMKVKNTERAIQLQIKTLKPFDDYVQIRMLEKAIMNSWKSVYRLNAKELEELNKTYKSKENKYSSGKNAIEIAYSNYQNMDKEQFINIFPDEYEQLKEAGYDV
jgi:SOS-response transcriptional repressor LexA